MKIIKRKIDNVVVFVGTELSLSTSGAVGHGFKAPNVTSAGYALETVFGIPDDWRGGWYSYADGIWIKTNQWESGEPAPPTVKEVFTALKTDFVNYIMGHYDLGTQGTIQMAYMNEDSSLELKAKAKAVGDWILSVQAYYKAKKLLVLAGGVETEWDFSGFDATKPVWDFDDFV
jgi:hypothetical protein